MKAFVEHANITVTNLERTIHFLQTAMPDFQIRHQGKNTKRWCHLGTEDSYLALQEPEPEHVQTCQREAYNDLGLNHVGFVVDNINKVSQRLIAAGFRNDNEVMDETYRKRCYVFDQDGIEWEFVEYVVTEPSLKNSYEEA